MDVGSLAHVKPSRERGRRRRRLELRARTRQGKFRASCCSRAALLLDEQVARRLKHHHHRRLPPPRRPTLRPPPPLLHSPISTSSRPLTSSTALNRPYTIAICARSQHIRLQYPPTTRRIRSLHIIHHGSAIENACCCPRNGWRRRCSSAGKSCVFVLFRNTIVLACSCKRTRQKQPTIRMPKELFVGIHTWSMK
jgi:hypothetical protein